MSLRTGLLVDQEQERLERLVSDRSLGLPTDLREKAYAMQSVIKWLFAEGENWTPSGLIEREWEERGT